MYTPTAKKELLEESELELPISQESPSIYNYVGSSSVSAKKRIQYFSYQCQKSAIEQSKLSEDESVCAKN